MEPIHNFHPAVCCWNCEHFQRYDQSQQPQKCDGECRRAPIPGALFITDFMPDPQDPTDFGHNKETAYYWPHITCGLRMRCSYFDDTMEQDNPQSPMSFACQHEAPTSVAEWKPWVKPSREFRTCWTCGWFEPALCHRKHKEQPDNGCCLHDPPRPRQFHQFEAIYQRAEVGATPTITGALSLWCSRWDGPRPEIGYTAEDIDPVRSGHEAYTKWEAGRERLTWLSSMQISKVKEIASKRSGCPGKQKSKIITLDKIRPVK